MKDKVVNLTEQQLAEVFQTHSQKHQAQSDASDCLSAMAGSSSRLQHAEDLISDHATAQAFKAALSMQAWSTAVAESVEQARRPWFSFLGLNQPLKATLAATAFAFAMVVAVPEIKHMNDQESLHQPMSQIVVQNDVINHIKFDDPIDQLNKAGFDQVPTADKDQVFDGSFG